jgi:protein-disulfide isomerase
MPFLSTRFVVAAAALTLSVAGSAFAQGDTSLSAFNAKQQAQIKAYVNSAIPHTLMSHPEDIFNSVKKFQQAQQQKRVDAGKQMISTRIDAFLRDPATPVVNPNGKVTLVEFYDYQCSVCHMMFPIINAVAHDNPNLRIVYKDFPIFGPVSTYAAKGSFAAWQQSPKLYDAYHNALFHSGLMEGKLTIAAVDQMAKRAGLSMAKFHAAIKSKAVAAAVQSNMNLAQSLKLTGTPALIVAPTSATSKTPIGEIGFIPGGARQGQLEQMVKQIQSKS